MTRHILPAAVLAAIAATAAGLAVAAPAGAPAGPGLYAQNCAACHQPAGQGIPGAFPALARDPFVVGDPARVVQVLLNGRGGMPTFRDSLTDAQVAAVVTHIRTSWGNRAAPVPPALVTRLRGTAQGRTQRPIPGH